MRITAAGRMTDQSWYRSTTWTLDDQQVFEKRLARSRGQRPEYLRIQALTLAATRQVENARPAIDLAKRYLQEHADGLFTAQIYLTLAKAHTTLGEINQAVDAFRQAVIAENARPNVRDLAYLEFAWFAATRGLTGLYDEVTAAMNGALQQADLVFPATQYRYFGALALISADLNDKEYAKRMASDALAAAARDQGPFSRHSKLGLVSRDRDKIRKRLEKLAR
jgi:hypothetical protein